MEMSKDSLKQQEQYDGAKRRKTRSDEIYDLIRTMAAGSKTLKIPEIKERYIRVCLFIRIFNLTFLRCTAKGFKPDDIEKCLEEYEQLDVWQLNQAKTKLTIVN